MPSHRYPIIAKEGWNVLIVLTVIAIVVAYKLGYLYSIPVWVFLLALLYLYRDPFRTVPSSPLAVVSPVGGVVESVSNVKGSCLGEEAVSLRIKMDFHSCYSIRSPIEGKVGHALSAEHAGVISNSGSDRRQTFSITSDEGDVVIMSICVKKGGSRLRCYVCPGERVGQGQRCGYFFLGGVVEVLVPANTRLAVKEGDRVLSGSSVLGQLVSQGRENLQGMTRPILT